VEPTPNIEETAERPARILIVRLGALGDIVHAMPAVAAIRRSHPAAHITWIADVRHAALVDLIDGIDERVTIDPGGRWRATAATLGALRRRRYDAALDLQGLLKSALVARLSGATRVVGFARAHLREPLAAAFYTERVEPPGGVHVMRKNLAIAARIGAHGDVLEFPFKATPDAAVALVRARLGIGESSPFALINPGAGWPNKRWPAERLGAVSQWMRSQYGLPSAVLWGPGEEPLAARVAEHSSGAARVAPPTTLPDLLALARAASLMIAGDTGPLHLATAVGTPVVGLFGPTNPVRNGPWSPEDVSVSRFEECMCHHRRRCRRGTACIDTVTIEDVRAAVERRLETARR
jgi:heptosyltransferase I